jgi:hypothetical protein
MNRKTGMTLIEVLIAVIFVGVALVTLLTATSRCLATMRSAKIHQNAHFALTAGEAAHPYVETNELASIDVDRDEFPNGMIFSRKVDEDEDEDGLFVVRSMVTWTERGIEGPHEEVVRYVYRPNDLKK